MKLAIGIDPGLDGAVSAYDGVTLRVWDMPTLPAGVGGKRIINRGALFDLLTMLADAGPTLAAVEKAVGVIKQSADSSCKTGEARGYAAMAVVGNKESVLPHTVVQ
jgi:hypothetical protein